MNSSRMNMRYQFKTQETKPKNECYGITFLISFGHSEFWFLIVRPNQNTKKKCLRPLCPTLTYIYQNNQRGEEDIDGDEVKRK